MLTEHLHRCQIALEIPDEYEEANGQLPRVAFKDHLCRYHTLARQDELQNVITDFHSLLDGYLPLIGGTLTGDLIIDDAKLRLQSGHSFVNVDINELTMFMYGGNHGGSRSQLKSSSLALSFRTTDHGHSSTLNTQYLTFNPVEHNSVVDGSWRIGLCRSHIGYGEIAYKFLAERYDGSNWESMYVFGESQGQEPLSVSDGLLMDFTYDNVYNGSVSRVLCVDFGTGYAQSARGNHGHSQLHTHDNFSVIHGITQEDIDRWNAGDSGHNPLILHSTNETELGRLYANNNGTFLQSRRISFEVGDQNNRDSFTAERSAATNLLPNNILFTPNNNRRLRFKDSISERPYVYDVYPASDTTIGSILCVNNVKDGVHRFLITRTAGFGDNGCRIVQEAKKDEFIGTIKGFIADEVSVTRTITLTVENPVQGDIIPILAMPTEMKIGTVYAFVSNGTVTGDIRYGLRVGTPFTSIFAFSANKQVTSVNEFRDCGTIENPPRLIVFPPRCLWLHIEGVTGTPRAVTYSIHYTELGLRNVV